MNKLRPAIFLLVLQWSFTVTFAQTNDLLKEQLIKDWVRAKEYTKAYLEIMPAEKYAWRPTDSIRTFAQQMLHLAQGNVNLISNGTNQERPWQGRLLEKIESAQSKDSVIYFVLASYDFCIDGVKQMDLSKAGEIVKRGNFEVTRLGWVMKTFEHQTHHRGQTTIYIRTAGIRPPNEMLF